MSASRQKRSLAVSLEADVQSRSFMTIAPLWLDACACGLVFGHGRCAPKSDAWFSKPTRLEAVRNASSDWHARASDWFAAAAAIQACARGYSPRRACNGQRWSLRCRRAASNWRRWKGSRSPFIKAPDPWREVARLPLSSPACARMPSKSSFQPLARLGDHLSRASGGWAVNVKSIKSRKSGAERDARGWSFSVTTFARLAQ